MWHWHVARIISSQKIYGLYGLKHHTYSGDERRCYRCGTNNKQRTVKIELLSQWKLAAEFRNSAIYDVLIYLHLVFIIRAMLKHWTGKNGKKHNFKALLQVGQYHAPGGASKMFMQPKWRKSKKRQVLLTWFPNFFSFSFALRQASS